MNYTSLSVALTLSLFAACEAGFNIDTGETALLPAAAFFVPTPGNSRGAQALCEGSVDAHDAVMAIVESENDALAQDRALIEALLEEAPVEISGVSVYEAEVDGRSLRLEVTTDGADAFAYFGELTEEGETIDYLTGAMSNGGKQGSLSVTPANGDALNVAWSEGEGTLDFVRSGASTAVVSHSEEAIKIVRDDTIIFWDLTDFEGVVLDGEEAICFEGGEDTTDFCDIECDANALSQVGG